MRAVQFISIYSTTSWSICLLLANCEKGARKEGSEQVKRNLEHTFLLSYQSPTSYTFFHLKVPGANPKRRDIYTPLPKQISPTAQVFFYGVE